MTESITIELGDPESPYPPMVAPENVEKLRRWIAKNTTSACAMGYHSYDTGGCHGVCALHSDVVPERPCLCPCHSDRYASSSAVQSRNDAPASGSYGAEET